MLKRIFRLSKPDTGKDNTILEEAQAQEDADAAEPSTDIPSVTGPLVVSPNFAKDITSEPPDQSAEQITNDLNEMALRDVSKPPPKPSESGKRKRQESDSVEKPPMKVAKTSGATEHEDKPPITSTNGTTGHEDGSNRASLEAGEVAAGKLARPKQMQRHMIKTNPQWAPSGDEYDFPPSPGKQVEESAPTPITGTRNPSSANLTPRRRGRPRVGASATQKTTSMEKGQGRKVQDVQAKPGRTGRKRQAGPKALPNALPKADIDLTDDKKEETSTSRTTRSTATAKGSKDVNSNTKTKVKSLHASNGGKSTQARAKKAVNGVGKDQSSNIEVRPGFQNRAISAQYEGEEGEGDDSETGGSEYTEAVVNTAGRRLTQTDEGDEGQAEEVEDDPDVEDPTKANEIDEEENEDQELELFGQDKAWKTVLDGARSVCDPELPLNQMPKHLTRRLKDLIYAVSEARSSYEQLLLFKGLSHDGLDGLNDDLTKSFDAIEDQIKNLSERNAAGKASKIIEHLFTCAIPAMVFLLQSALLSRVYHSDEPCALESLNEIVNGLSEIVRLQKMTILLCEKAKNWKAKPDPSIKSPTTRKILPCLRAMREVFSNVLSEQDRKRKMKQNALDYRLRQKTPTKSPQQAKQEAAREDVVWQIKIKKSREQEDQKRRDEKRTLRQVKEDEARTRMRSLGVNGHVESKTIWSDAEDLALYFQLEKGYAGQLTCTFIQSHLLCQCCSLIIFAAAERYLNILNTPLLQNKLPEHIRDRALYFKPTLLEERGALEWISSID